MHTRLPTIEINETMNSLSQVIDWGLRESNVPETWKITQGEGVTIMVIDTGFPDHIDIGDNAIRGENFIPNEPLEDENGHQSHCGGIICGKNNGIGMVGVAPKAKVICTKALGRSGGGNYDGLAKALDHAIQVKPDIVSMSLGGNAPSPILHAKIKKLYGNGSKVTRATNIII